MRQEYSWFTHDIIKNQTKKLSILLNFYFQGSRFKFKRFGQLVELALYKLCYLFIIFIYLFRTIQVDTV